jgi:hypothetical protein
MVVKRRCSQKINDYNVLATIPEMYGLRDTAAASTQMQDCWHYF